MRKALLCIISLLLLAGCSHAQPATKSSRQTSASVSSQAKQPATVKPAKLGDLAGHYFVDVSDKTRILQFTASTSGYYLDVQESRDGQDFKSIQAGIFNATITCAKMTYTVAGTAQPNAPANSIRFEKLSNTEMQQLPDGPTYRRVAHDDITTLY